MYCFDVGELRVADFDPVAFVAIHQELVPLEQLRQDLHSFLASLKQDLYDLINRDYVDFILVSSKLSGVDEKVAELERPVAAYVTHVSSLHEALSGKIKKVEAVMAERLAVQEQKRALRKCLLFISLLEHAEELLGIGNAGDTDGSSGGAGRRDDYDMLDSGEGNMFEDKLELYGDAEDDALGEDERADAEFASVFASFAEPSGGEDGGLLGDRDAKALTETCAMLERVAHYALMMNADLVTAAGPNGDQATSVNIKSMSVRASRVEAEVTRRLRTEFAGLVAPPPLQRLSGHAEGRVPVNEAALLHCLRSFAALGSGAEAERQFARVVMEPFVNAKFTQGLLDGGERGSCRGLKEIYTDTIAFVEGACADTLQAAEKLFGQPSDGEHREGGNAVMPELATQLPVDLLCNGVWLSVFKALTSRLQSVFATGLAPVLRSNYTLTVDFIDRLADVCGPQFSHTAKLRLHQHPTMAELRSRWNLPIYFQLCAREVSLQLEAAYQTFSQSGVQAEEGTQDDGRNFELAVTGTLWHTLQRCWAEDLFLPPLAHRFLRLCLQILASYASWLFAFVPSAGAEGQGSSRPVEEIILVAWDASLLLQRVCGEYMDQIHACFKAAQLPDEASVVAREAVTEAVSTCLSAVPQLWSVMASHVGSLCNVMLQAVKGITATYRMTNKPPPERPSAFVPNILRPLRDFEKQWGSKMPLDVRSVWRRDVLKTVTAKYLATVREMLATVRQMEEALSKRKTTKASKKLTAGGMSDTQKIMSQLVLDVTEFSKEMAALGFQPHDFEDFVALQAEVEN